MRLKCAKKIKQEKKSYDISQSALYKTSSKSKLAAIYSLSVPQLLNSIGDFKCFEMTPKPDPFNIGKQPKPRWVQKPKGKLLAIHERTLKLLRCVQVPGYMQSALKGTSYKRNAESHLAGRMVATLDISSFFRSTTKSQVFNFSEIGLSAQATLQEFMRILLPAMTAYQQEARLAHFFLITQTNHYLTS